MPNVKLASTLPSGGANGLALLAGDLVADPQKWRVVIALVDCSQITTNSDTEQVVPTARVRRIVPVADQDLATAKRLMTRSHEGRTGQTMLPYELEEEFADAFTPSLDA